MDPRGRMNWLVLAGAAALLSLVAVHLLEGVGHYLPCELCLRQRDADWVALAVAVAGVFASRRRPEWAAPACLLVGVAFAAGAVVAAYHAGVEWRWWPGPTTCTGHASAPVSAADLQAVMSGAVRPHMVRCDEAALRIAGLSLAGWNALGSGALAAFSFFAAFSRRRV